MSERRYNAESSWKSAIAGGIAGFTSRMLISPFDVIKIRLQLQQDPRKVHDILKRTSSTPGMEYDYRGIIQTIRVIAREEGVTAFWKGNSPALALYVSYASIQFTSFHRCDSLLRPLVKSEKNRQAAAGGFAGVMATLATYPLDFIRTRMVSQRHTSNGVLTTVRNVIKSDGILGFYRGSWTSLVSIAPQMATVFWVYRMSSDSLSRLNQSGIVPLNNATISFISGGSAGISGKLLILPLDILRKRLQVMGTKEYGSGIYAVPMRRMVIEMFKREGLLSFYKGALPSILKTGPSSAITFFTYELVMWALH